jgi:hypothetical protein
LRIAFSAVSTASAPPLDGNARASPVSRASRSIKTGSRSLWNARDVTASLRACATSAATIAGCAWPKLTAEYALMRSR